MRFSAQNLQDVLNRFGMTPRAGTDLSSYFEGGFFNRESFNTANAALDEAGRREAGHLGDALDFAFGRNSKDYTSQAIQNAGTAYQRNGQVGLGNFALPTHSSSQLMNLMETNAAAAAFGGAAIGGIVGAAMGNDAGESAVFGGVAGAAMFGMGRGLRSGAFMEQIERRAISSVLGKSHDELVAGKQAVYREAVDEGLGVERINAQKADTDRLVNEHRQEELDRIGYRQGQTKEELGQRLDIEDYNDINEEIDKQLSEISNNEIVGIDRRTNQPLTRNDFNNYTDLEKNFAVQKFDETSMSKEEYIKQREESLGTLSPREKEIVSETSEHPEASKVLQKSPNTDDDMYTEADIQNYQLPHVSQKQNINADVSEADYQRYMATKDQTLEGGPNEERILSVQGKNQKPGEVTLNPNHPKNQPSMSKEERLARNKLALQEKKNFEKERETAKKTLDAAKKNKLSQEEIAKLENSYNQLTKQDSKEVGLKRAERQFNRNRANARQQQEASFNDNLTYVNEEAVKKADATKTTDFLDELETKAIENEKGVEFQDVRDVSEERTREIIANRETAKKTLDEARRSNLPQEEIDKIENSYNQLMKQSSSDPTAKTEKINERLRNQDYRHDRDINSNEVYDNDRVIMQSPEDRARLNQVEIRKRMLQERNHYEKLNEEDRRVVKDKIDEGLAREGNLSDNINYEKVYNESIYNPKQKLNEAYGAEYDNIVESQKASKQKQAELQKQKEELAEKNRSQKTDPFAVKKETAALVTSQTDPSKIESGKMNVFNLDNAFYQTGEGVLSMRPNELKDFPLDESQRLVSQTNSNIFGERMISPQTPFSPRTQDLLQKTSSTNATDLNTNFEQRTIPLANKELLQEAVATPTTSFMGKQAQKLLRSGPDHNVGMQTRHMVLGGSMLAGAAFGSKRKDHSRGFNSHRGNRI